MFIPLWILVILCIIAAGSLVGIFYLISILLHMFDGF